MKRTKRIAAALLALLLLSACAETPKEDIVTNKNEGFLENKIESSTGTETPLVADKRDFATFTSSDGKVIFDFDSVEISVPDAARYSVLRVTPHYFTSEEVERIAAVVCQGNPVYEYSEELTKKEIEERILQIQMKLDPDYLFEHYKGDEVIIASTVKEYETQIAALEAAYDTASDTSEPVLSDFQFRPEGEWYPEWSALHSYDEQDAIMATSNVNGIPFQIKASVRNDENYRLSNMRIFVYDMRMGITDQHSFIQPEAFTEETFRAAIDDITQAISDMQIGEWKLGSCNYSGTSESGVYELNTKWQHIYNEIPSALVPQFSAISSKARGDDMYAPDFYQEELVINYSDGRIVDFQYSSPMDVIAVLNENVEVITVENAVDKINRQLELSYSGAMLSSKAFYLSDTTPGAIQIVSAKVIVTRVELGLARLRIKDESKDFYLLPVWVVYGNNVMDRYRINGEERQETQTDWSGLMPEYLFCINGVDGSVVDVMKGY